MLRNLVRFSPILILLLVPIPSVVNEKAPELPAQLQELISDVSANNIQNPADLPTWLLAFFMSYERFRHCATKGTCPKNNAFSNLEDLRHKISSYVQSDNEPKQKNVHEKYTSKEPLDPAYYNDELYPRQTDSVPFQQNYHQSSKDYSNYDQEGAFSYQRASGPHSYNFENTYDRRYEQLEQPKSYQPRPFGFHNTEYPQEKTQSKKSIDFYHDYSPVHVPLPLHAPVHVPVHAPVHVPVHSPVPVPVHVPVPVVHSYYQPSQDIYVQCLKSVQICVPTDHCHYGQIHGHEPVPPHTGDFCNVRTHVCCHLPIKEEHTTQAPPRFVTFHKPNAVVNQVSNATIKEINNRIVKYIFLGKHNLTSVQNETLSTLTAENVTNILPELMEGNMSGIYEILNNSNILVNSSDLVMNTIINSTIDKINNYITKYIFLHPHQNISSEDNFELVASQMTNVTSPESELFKNLTIQFLEQLRNINKTIINLQENSTASFQYLNKAIDDLATNQTQKVIETVPPPTFMENFNSSYMAFEKISSTTTTTKRPPQKYLPPASVYLPPKPSNKYIPQPSNMYIPQKSHTVSGSTHKEPQQQININQRISDSAGLSIPNSAFGVTGFENVAPDTLPPNVNPTTQANIVNNPVVETTAATTSTQNFVTLNANCPASMTCTREMFCDGTGFITDTPVSESERLNGVVLMDCINKANGVEGKCCRNRDTTDRVSSLQLDF